MQVCVKLSCVLLRKVRHEIQISVVRGKVVTSNGRASMYMAYIYAAAGGSGLRPLADPGSGRLVLNCRSALDSDWLKFETLPLKILGLKYRTLYKVV